MTNSLSRKSLLGAVALMATLSAPLAFAQTAQVSAEATPPTEAATQAEAGSQATTATATTQAGTAPAKKSWADVDADQDGSLSMAEASAVPALAQVFATADGDADGVLTADEYKAYVAKVQGAAAAQGSGG